MNVILIHGLFTGAWIMRPLGNYLAQHGLTPHYFDYASRDAPPNVHAQALQQFITQHDLLPCHFVAHSLGGLVWRDWVDITPDWTGRAVTLGSPHQGSAVAQKLHQIMPNLIGQSWEQGLNGQLPEWTRTDIAVGNIIGINSTGLGKLIADLPQPNDGTVAQSETELSGSLICKIHCGHTSLLFHPTAAQQTAYFLHHGQFQML